MDLALPQGDLSRAAAYQGLIQFIRKGERNARQQYGAEPINRPSWMRLASCMRLCSIRWRTNERLVGA